MNFWNWGVCFEAAEWKYQYQVHGLIDDNYRQDNSFTFHTDVSLKLLSKDLEGVWRWYPLSLQLGVPDADLMMIENDYQRTEDRKLRSLSKWMDIDEQPSWSKVVRALVAINERHVARTIAEKYGIYCYDIIIVCKYIKYLLYVGVPFPSELESETSQEETVTANAIIKTGVSIDHCGLIVAVMCLSYTAVG